jgi:hypothetical protein
LLCRAAGYAVRNVLLNGLYLWQHVCGTYAGSHARLRSRKLATGCCQGLIRTLKVAVREAVRGIAQALA